MTSIYRDDFERHAHDIINVVKGGSWSGSAPQWQIEKIAAMLRVGPGVTVWPRDAAEAAQVARERVLRRPPAVKMPPIKPPGVAMIVPPKGPPTMMAFPPLKKP